MHKQTNFSAKQQREQTRANGCSSDDMIRSVLFGAIGRVERVRVRDLAIPGPNDITIFLDGWRLDQIDAEIFFWLHDRAKGTKPGELIYFRLWDLPQQLGYKKNSDEAYELVKERIKQMGQTTVSFKFPDNEGGVGSLIPFYEIETSTKEAAVGTNGFMRRFFDCVYLSTDPIAALHDLFWKDA